VREGDIGGRFYVITAGEVEVTQRANGTDEPIRRMGPGAHFGELALLGDNHRTATVRAVTDTSVLSIARQDFATLVEHLPALQGALTQPRSDQQG
jgi:CRP-like cAMP-binding protein